MSQDSECIFCRIVAGTIPAATVLSTDSAVAFLDINPLADGHTLLIPRRHVTTLDAMPPDDLKGLVGDLPALVRAVMAASGATGCNVLQNNGRVAGQVVQHVHFHIIPRVADDRLGYRWNAGTYPTGRVEQIQNRIKAELAG